jgi:DNA-binding NarL/FixJ family response regulator
MSKITTADFGGFGHIGLGIIQAMTEPSFVLIIEDHPLYKQALVSLLKLSFPEHDIVAYNNAEEAQEFLSKRSNQSIIRSLALLDLTLPGLSGIELISRFHHEHPDLQIAVISGSDEAVKVGACLGAGARAYINKNTTPDRIVDLIGRALHSGLPKQTWVNISGVQSLDNIPKIHLTSRQIQVLVLVCKGLTNKQIADELDTVEATAKAHVSAILRELGVDSRTQALLVAQKLGFHE